MTSEVRQQPAGPTPSAARALGPDLARGFMLLFIALANTHYFLPGPVFGGYPRGGSAIDSAVTWLLSTFVDGRAFPMFGLLFGYGVARIAARQEHRGRWGVRRLLWRRSLVLVTVGLLDALLFYVGDILAAYGVLLLVGAWMVRWKDRWLLLIAAGFLALTALPTTDFASTSRDGPDPAMLPVDLGSMIADRAPAAALVALAGPIGFLCPFLIGLVAGRRRVLEEPDRHRRLLASTAVLGLGAALLGAQPLALARAGATAIPADSSLAWMASLHDATGLLGGIGYAALLCLIAGRVRSGAHPLVQAIAATGQRSMTCYLLQSVTWALVFTPFLLNLSGRLTVTTTALLAASTWAMTVFAADRMRRANRRGPFEVLIRRITYGSNVARPAVSRTR